MTSGETLKREGLAKVAENNERWLTWIRLVAHRIATENGTVSTDDLRPHDDEYDLHPHHRNAWGAVFRGDEWEVVDYRKSKYKSNRSRRIAVWRLKQRDVFFNLAVIDHRLKRIGR